MLITNRISYLLVMLGLQLSACSHSAMPTIPRSVGSPGTDCRTQLLADLEDWERSDRLNSTSWCAEGCSGVNIYYADQGEKTGLLIRQLEQGRKVSIEDVDEPRTLRRSSGEASRTTLQCCACAMPPTRKVIPGYLATNTSRPIDPQLFGLHGIYDAEN